MVSTAVGGTIEVIEDGVSGMLVPTGDAGRMADAVLALLDHSNMRARFRENGFERAKRFDTREMVNSHKSLYNVLIRG